VAFFFSSSSTDETVPSSALRAWPPKNLHFNPMRQEPVASKTGHRIGKSTELEGCSDSSVAFGRDTKGGSSRSADSSGKKMSLGLASR
jgi:hypothetical protein